MIMSELLGASIPDPRARIETYKNKHKDILKISAAHKSKENAVLNAARLTPLYARRTWRHLSRSSRADGRCKTT